MGRKDSIYTMYYVGDGKIIGIEYFSRFWLLAICSKKGQAKESVSQWAKILKFHLKMSNLKN